MSAGIVLLLLCGSVFAQEHIAQEHIVGVLKFEPPSLAPIAKVANVTGEVKMKVTVDGNGDVQRVEVLSGHPMLRESAAKTVSKWRFTCLDCKFGESFDQQVTFAYFLAGELGCESEILVRFEYKFPTYAALYRSRYSMCGQPGYVRAAH